MRIEHRDSPGLTAVPDVFIDDYMRAANGEFVKVYIYLLRLAGRGDGAAELSVLADHLDLTEKDVVRALRYWEKQGLLTLSGQGDRIEGLALCPLAGKGEQPLPEEDAAPALRTETFPEEDPGEAVPDGEPAAAEEAERGSAESAARLQGDEDFRQMIYVAEKYLGRTLSPKDVQLFAYLYEELKFPEELIEYLIEYCVDSGHRTNRYLETVALSWHREGIATVQQAKEAHRAYSRENRQVMQAFGISGRILSTEERRYIDRWVKEYHMPLDVVAEACSITILATHEPKFEYAERILKGWRDAGVRSLEDARSQQEKRRISRKRQQAGEKNTSSEPVRNRFRNYEQRDVDYDALIAGGQWN